MKKIIIEEPPIVIKNDKPKPQTNLLRRQKRITHEYPQLPSESMPELKQT